MIARRSGHDIQHTQPQLVIDHILKVVSAVRNGDPLLPSPASARPAQSRGVVSSREPGAPPGGQRSPGETSTASETSTAAGHPKTHASQLVAKPDARERAQLVMRSPPRSAHLG